MKSFLTKKAVLSVVALSGTAAVTAYYKGVSITNVIGTITGCIYLATPTLPPVNTAVPEVPPAPTIIQKSPQLGSTGMPKVLDKVDISPISKDFFK